MRLIQANKPLQEMLMAVKSIEKIEQVVTINLQDIPGGVTMSIMEAMEAMITIENMEPAENKRLLRLRRRMTHKILYKKVAKDYKSS